MKIAMTIKDAIDICYKLKEEFPSIEFSAVYCDYCKECGTPLRSRYYVYAFGVTDDIYSHFRDVTRSLGVHSRYGNLNIHDMIETKDQYESEFGERLLDLQKRG